jgi:hypothetical protein
MCQPGRQVIRRRLPQHEVAGVALVGCDLDTSAGEQVFRAATGEFAIAGVGPDGEQYMPLGGVGMAGCNQALDDHDHFGDMRRGARFLIRGEDTEGCRVGVVVGRGAGGDGLDRFAGFK